MIYIKREQKDAGSQGAEEEGSAQSRRDQDQARKGTNARKGGSDLEEEERRDKRGTRRRRMRRARGMPNVLKQRR
jgi:hypothetical protein